MRTPVSTDTPSVWTPSDFPDETVWSFNLSEADRDALTAYALGGTDEQLAQHFSVAAEQWGGI